MPPKISILSLGCARNLIDSEVILGILRDSGFEIADVSDGVDVAIVNTCAFIEDAKKESIDAILDLVELKKAKGVKRILLAGCLPQRYADALRHELREVDGFIGVGGFEGLPKIVKALMKGQRPTEIPARPRYLYDHKTPRVRLTPRHYAYVKISEGCSHKCSFCVIPKLRGPHRSRQENSVLKEAAALLKSGAREINLIGQDTTLYGMDLYGHPALPGLLKKLVKIKGGAKWIRLLYSHPAHFTDELIKVIREEPVICKYIDLPIQHISDKILKKMKRATTKKSTVGLLDKIRRNIQGVAIRTSIIVGFPGESEVEFKELLEFIKDERFERLGAFIYSREEDTPAYDFPDQISDKEKRARWDEVMKAQQEISRENNSELLGRELDVIIDEKDACDPRLYLGRSYMDAPEVDGIVYIRSAKRKAKSAKLKIGGFARVKIIDTYEYDLVGTAL